VSAATLTKPRRRPKAAASHKAELRPPRQRRVRRGGVDSIEALDVFAGFGGMSRAMEAAGIDVIHAANHNPYAIDIHEANHPHAEHLIADLVDSDRPDYRSAADLPYAGYAHFSPSCFVAGTIIVTSRGLVPIEDVKIGDEVWTHKSRWRRVTDTSVVMRPTVTVTGGGAWIECTSDHPFWAAESVGSPMEPGQPEWVGASDLAKKWIATPILGGQEEGPFLIPARKANGRHGPRHERDLTFDARLAYVAGRWLGDGWVSKDREVMICTGHADGDALEAELLSRFPKPAGERAGDDELRWHRSKKLTATVFTTGSITLAEFLTDHFGRGAAGKTIPIWLYGMNAEIRQAFFDGYIDADGHWAKSHGGRRCVAATVSKPMAVGLRLLFASLGSHASMTHVRRPQTTVIEGREVRQKDQWSIGATFEPLKRPEHRRVGEHLWSRTRGVFRSSDELVPVFNMTVDEDHTYVADGIVVHNCVNHSRANAQKLYLNSESGLDDPDLLERATVSERSRATMTCVLTYMAKHRPLVVSVENVSEVQSWGKRVEGKSYGDGSTWRWWCREVRKLGYDFRVVYLNAQHFGVPQSRDRLFVGIWRTDLTAPDFEHRPSGHCDTCGDVELVQFRKPVPPSGRMTFGRQYWYICPACDVRVDPPATPAYEALDFTDLGPTIRERLESGKIPAASTMARLERAAAMLPSFPALLVPAKSQRGTVRLANQPMATLTTQHETGLLAAAQVVAAGNTFEHPGSNCRIRSVDAPMPVQTTTNTGSLLSTAVLPYRANTLPTGHHRPMPTQTCQQVAGMLTARSGLVKQNGGAMDTRPQSVTGPLGTITTVDTTALVTMATADFMDLHWRMLGVAEIQRGMGFDDDFVSWGSSRARVFGFGNAVVPAQGQWVAEHLTACLRG